VASVCSPPLRQAATTLCASKILRFLASLSVEIGVAHFEYLDIYQAGKARLIILFLIIQIRIVQFKSIKTEK